MSEYISLQKKNENKQGKLTLLFYKSGSEYKWLDGSQKVTIRGDFWHHQYEQKDSDAIDFIRKFYNKYYVGAV